MSDYPKGTKYITVRNEIWQCVVEQPPQKRDIPYISRNKIKSKIIDFPFYQIFYVRANLHTNNMFYPFIADTKLVVSETPIVSTENKVNFLCYPNMYPDGRIITSSKSHYKFEDLVSEIINKFWESPINFYYNQTYFEHLIERIIGFKPKLKKNKVYLRPIEPVPLYTLFYNEVRI